MESRYFFRSNKNVLGFFFSHFDLKCVLGKKKGGGVVLEDDQPPFIKSLDLLKVNAFKKEISRLSACSWWGNTWVYKSVIYTCSTRKVPRDKVKLKMDKRPLHTECMCK